MNNLANDAGGVKGNSVLSNGKSVETQPEVSNGKDWAGLGREAFTAFLSTLKPKEGGQEIWLKTGHSDFWVGEWNESGDFDIWRTRGKGKGRSRIIPASGSAYAVIRGVCDRTNGGAFYIPTQPQGLPLKDNVDSTDDIPFELDEGTREEQLAKIEEFKQHSGLDFSSLLTSGGKSVHGHIKATEHLPLDQAQYLRRLIVISLMSDAVTIRLHQPMRIPGFFRKEKAQEQELLYFSHTRYTYDELVDGFRKFFLYKGWGFPEQIPEKWFHESVWVPLKQKGVDHTEKCRQVVDSLFVGVNCWEIEQNRIQAERAERAAKYEVRRLELAQLGQESLVDLIDRAEQGLGRAPFDRSVHDWKFSNSGHARGRCPWHKSDSGNSAWLSDRGGFWGYHCPVCTDDKPIGAFQYELSVQADKVVPLPKGREWAEQSKPWLESHGVEVPKFKPKPQTNGKVPQAVAEAAVDAVVGEGDILIESWHTPGLLAAEHLYPDRENYVTCGDNVYRFNGMWYELVDPGKRRNAIANLFERCVKFNKQGELLHPYFTSKNISCAFNAVHSLFKAVKPDDFNKDGINFRNGVLKIEWEGRKLKHKLVPHDPGMVFTAEPKVTFNPIADTKYMDQMFLSVEPEYLTIVKRTFAATFDIHKARKEQHRPVRIAAFLGDGSNGKDALKFAMMAVLGRGALSSVSLTAFLQYDQGRQFGLTGLAGSRLNWPSENSFYHTLDNIECIKSVVTGNELQYEEKNQKEKPFTPSPVLIFNGNAENLRLIGGSEAIRSRYAIIPFNKVFKRVPDVNDPNELKSDPRFQDIDWLAENVCPALVNTLLFELEALVNEGIDYSPCDAIMAEHTKASFHLAEFIADFDIVASKGDRIDINDLWEWLMQHYEQEGMASFEVRDGKQKTVWGADPRPGDRLIRSKQQLSSQIIKFIPGATNKGKGATSNGHRYITNIKRLSTIERTTAKLEECFDWEEYLYLAKTVSQDSLHQAWNQLNSEDRSRIERLSPAHQTAN